MDSFFASPEMPICRTFRNACAGTGSTVLGVTSAIDPVRDFAYATESGLLSAPRRLQSRFLYDAQGSELFERITQQPEYYLTSIETSILAGNAANIRNITGAVPLIELGSGSAAKIAHLLTQWVEHTPSVCYVPIDVSESALYGACSAIRLSHPQVKVIGVNAEYQDAFPLFGQLSPALVLFLGSSIGNFTPSEMSRFLTLMAAAMDHGHYLLLGIDLVKDRARMEAAYNDAAGVTAAFTRNLFARMNRELGCSIDIEAIEHVARYNADHEQIETFACFTKQQTFHLAPIRRQLTIPQGEMVQIEISRKFRLEQIVPYLRDYGFDTEEIFLDERRWFALLLLRRSPSYLALHRR